MHLGSSGERRDWSDVPRQTSDCLPLTTSGVTGWRRETSDVFDDANQIRVRRERAICSIKFFGRERKREKEEGGHRRPRGGLRRLCAAGESFGVETARERKFPRTSGNKSPGEEETSPEVPDSFPRFSGHDTAGR